jgi:hypothetical protein
VESPGKKEIVWVGCEEELRLVNFQSRDSEPPTKVSDQWHTGFTSNRAYNRQFSTVIKYLSRIFLVQEDRMVLPASSRIIVAREDLDSRF